MVSCLSTILQTRFYAQSRDFPLSSNIPVCFTFHFLDSPSKGLQAIYKLWVGFAIQTFKVYLSSSPLSLFLCLLWLWLKKRRSWEIHAHECIWSHFICWVRCMPRQSFLNGCLSNTRTALELFPPIAQIHYLLFYCIYLQVHTGPSGRPQSSSNEA